MKEIMVKKRNGAREPLDLDKLHKVVFYACNDIAGVSPSEVEIKSSIQFYNGITTDEIQETLIKAAADLITEDTPNYQWVAGRLINYHLRKQVYNDFEPDHLSRVIEDNIDRGYYDDEILELYTSDELDQLNSYIKHDRDQNIAYVGMEQFRGKYLVQMYVSLVHVF
jgi:ribonucleoside-diphosphate reductase alpha chain